MDEIQACMISISDMETKSSDTKTNPIKTDISNRYIESCCVTLVTQTDQGNALNLLMVFQ